MFGSVGFIARTQLRRSWRSLVVLAVFAGLLGGVAISLVAGSRRSSSVVDRYFAAGLRYDLQIYAPSLTADDLLAIPGVIRADLLSYIGSVYLEPDGTVGGAINSVAIEPSSADPTIQVLDGRLDLTDPFSAFVNEAFAEEFGVGAGESVTMQMFGPEQMDDVSAGIYDDPEGPRYTFDVTAVVRTPTDIAVDELDSPGRTAASGDNLMLVPARFYAEHRHEFLDFGAPFDVQLADPNGDEAFMAAVEDLLVGEPEPPLYGPARFTEKRDTLNTPVDIETAALLSLGLALALSGVVAMAILLRTEQRSHDSDGPTLRALGLSVPQLRAVAASRALLVAIAASVIAVAVAVTLSGRYPVGIGRQIELEDGIQVNIAAISIGTFVLFVAIVSLGFAFGRSPRSRSGVRSGRLTLSSWLAGLGASADLVLGTHFAFERRRGSLGQSRQALLGGAAALAVVAALGTVVGGLDRLHDDSARHGFPWDVAIGNINFELSADDVADLTTDPRVETSTVARYGLASVDGAAIEVLAIDETGTAPPRVISGRLPASPSEIAIGARLLRRLDRGVGDTVGFSVQDADFDLGEETHDVEVTVVGVALPPVLGEFDLGELGIVTFEGIAAAGGNTHAQLVLAGLRGDDRDAAAADIDRDVTQEILTDVIPARIASLYRVRSLPLLGMALAGAMGTVILVSVLATGIRSRRRDLAMLRAMGLPSHRVNRILAWQGIAVATVMALIGSVLGALLGSMLWRALSHQLGVDDDVIVRPLIFGLVPALLVVAIATSLVSARRVRRAQVASLLLTSSPRGE